MLVSLLRRALGVRRNGDGFAARLHEGYARLQLGDTPGAKRMAMDILSEDPAFVGAHLLHAQAAADGGEWGIAMAAIERLLAIDPEHPDAHFIRGMVREQLGEIERAIEDYDCVLQIDASHTAALDRKGALHDGRGEFEDSLACANRLVQIDATSAHARHKLGITLREFGRLQDAEQSLRGAVALDAGFDDAYCHLALVLIDQGLFDEADVLLASVLARNADHAEARWTRAVSNLLRSRFEAAWDDYEWREHRRENPPRVSGVSEWDGSPIEGGYLLISPEQGLGDQIMFSSCIEDAMRLSPACVIECDPRLVAVFRRSFPGARVYGADATSPPPWLPELSLPLVAQLPMGSLPGRFRRCASDFPARFGYLVPEVTEVEAWRRRLGTLGGGPKIGLSWTGGGLKTRRRLRSLELGQLLPLFRTEGCHFVNLQYVDSSEEIEALRAQHGVTVHEFEEAQTSFDQTIALVGALDLVISVCTSVIHLAGAIGTPAWVMVPAAPEWRYMAAGAVMPWYSSVRLWRQETLGEWEGVVQAIAHELASFCQTYADGKRSGASTA